VTTDREWDSRFGAPLVEMSIRAIPNSPLYLFTAAPHHGEIFGSLCMLDLRKDDDHHMGQIQRITPDEAFPRRKCPDAAITSTARPGRSARTSTCATCGEHGAGGPLRQQGNPVRPALAALQTGRAPAHDQPIPLRARPCPTVIPSKLRPKGVEDGPKATVAVMNVYDSDLPFPKDAKIKWLRVVQNIPKTNQPWASRWSAMSAKTRPASTRHRAVEETAAPTSRRRGQAAYLPGAGRELHGRAVHALCRLCASGRAAFLRRLP